MTTDVTIETSSSIVFMMMSTPERSTRQMERYSLYLDTTETSTGGHPESDDEWCHHSDIVLSVTFNHVYRNKNSESFWGGSSFEVTEEVYRASRVYLAIVRYSDGGTFGRTVGYWEVMGAFKTEAEAVAMTTSIDKGTFKTDYPHLARPYMPWEGYFSGLQGTEVHSFPILDISPGNGRHGTKVVYH